MLTQREIAVLDFERSYWLVPGPKDRAIQESLGMTATRYYQILRLVVDKPEALDYDPLTVRRVRRTRDRRPTRPASRPPEN